MRKTALYLFVFVFMNSITAQVILQSEAKLPQIIPASPDVMAIVKGGELSANLHTGSANATIPIAELKLKGFSFPVSLNYSTTGMKLEEISSRVGIGWNLNCGGVITRIVRGKPDEKCINTPNPTFDEMINYTDPNNVNKIMNYLNQVSDPQSNIDGEPDEFRFNLLGVSGKFRILKNGTILQNQHNNIKIYASISSQELNSFQIIDNSGIRYFFGQENVNETTISHNLIGQFVNKSNIRTTWFLTKILLPSTEWIKFNYNPIVFNIKTGLSQTTSKLFPINQPQPCSVFDLGNNEQVKQNNIKYQSYYLSYVTTSTGTSLSFSYTSRPDISGDFRLSNILLTNDLENVMIKKVQFAYVDFPNIRFFLDKVIFSSNVAIAPKEEKIELTYIENSNIPSSTSFQQDHLGYYNGAYNNSLIPSTPAVTEVFYNYFTANREPNSIFAQKGLLKKIKFATGGTQEFEYESNKESNWKYVPVVSMGSLYSEGKGNQSVGTTTSSYISDTISINRTQTAKLYVEGLYTGPPPTPFCATNCSKVCIARVREVTSNNVVASILIEGYNQQIITVNLIAGGIYRVELEVWNSNFKFGKADLVYDKGDPDEYKLYEKEICGVRVKKVKSYDPVTNKENTKYYHYRSLYDTTTPSANLLYTYNNYVTDNNYIKRTVGLNGFCVCSTKVVTASSSVPLYVNSGSPVSYKWVIESDNESLNVNGGIEHTFLTTTGASPITIIGSPINDICIEPTDFLHGKEEQTIFFNENKNIIKKIVNEYSRDSRVSEFIYDNYLVRKKYEPLLIYPLTDESFKQFDLAAYNIPKTWEYLKSTTTTDYDLINNKTLVNRVEYNYETTTNVMPTKINTIKSNGDNLTVVKKYANDFTSDPLCNKLISNNRFSEVIEETNLLKTNILYKTKTYYKDWFNDGSIILPFKIEKQKGNNSIESRITYNKYDNYGNVLEVSKSNDIRISYLWDYKNSLPIAEITNSNNDFAYTSFEADAKGNWNYTGNPTPNNASPSGKKVLELFPSTSITYNTPLPTGKYLVSFWGNNNSFLINGSVPSSINTKNGWILFEKIINSNGNITIEITGSGLIDELRLHNEKSNMKTYCYAPEIGLITVTDINHQYQNYKYDEFNRLYKVIDWDNNILKKIEYKLQIPFQQCATTNPNWQETGVTRCQKNNLINNANNGLLEMEQKDLNTCSQTYLQTRWITTTDLHVTGCPIQDCYGENKRWVKNICETGKKILVSSNYLGNRIWECNYYYKWSDGFKTPIQSETNTNSCLYPE
jgi:hypothetical protein